MIRKKEDYGYWLYEHKYEEPKSFLNYVSQLGRKIRFNILLVTTKNIREEIGSWVSENINVEIKHEEPVFTIKIKRDFSDREVSVKAVIVQHPLNSSIYMIISDCKKSEFKEVISYLIRKHYPAISRLYLTNNEMRVIFNKLKQETGLDIRVTSAVGKQRLIEDKDEEFQHTNKKSQVTYTNEPYSDVFDDIIARDQWVDSVRFVAEKVEITEQNKKLRTAEFFGIMSRACFFSSKRNFDHLIDIIIPEAIKFAGARNTHLKLSSDTAKEKKPEPVVVKFDSELFAEPTKNKQYIDALAAFESSSLGEYHTNPYIHISMLDYLDGSSYDIWVLSSDMLVIIPQFSASMASLGRLVNHIFERIGEGKVEKYAELEITN